MDPSLPTWSPRGIVWEITLRCDQACPHCGSDAGRPAPNELSTAEALQVARQLKPLGCQKVTLIGGEAYLRQDLEQIVAALAQTGVTVTMQTGGRHLSPQRVLALKRAGLKGIGLSIEGTAPIHDRLRGNRGSLQAALQAADNALAAGLPVTANTQINKLNIDILPEICRIVRQHRCWAWHLQITVPTGRALQHPEWILQPEDMVALMDTAAALQLDARANPLPHEHHTFDIIAGDDLGYYGPHEETLRSRPGGAACYWLGCQAGCQTLGIGANGDLRPCASLVVPGYEAGNVRNMSVSEAWRSQGVMAFRRHPSTEQLEGFCASCYYAAICGAGCSSTAHAFLGKRGNNPYCTHRVLALRRRGIRERLEPAGPPEGHFRIVEEPI